jgi:hypothetical protein
MATTRQIVMALRDRLARTFGDHVYVIAKRPSNRIPNLVGNRDILIRPRGFDTVGETVVAAGRSNTPIRRKFDIVLRSRLAIDSVQQDLKWLEEQFDFEGAVFDALQMWMGNPETGEELLVGEGEPSRVVAGSDPERMYDSPDGRWGASVLVLDLTYRMDLNQEVQ